MIEEGQQKYQQFWDIYVKDQVHWLASHYQKTNVPDHQTKVLDIEKLFHQLKGKISASKFNKGGDYFKNFAKKQQEKYKAITSKLKDFFVNMKYKTQQSEIFCSEYQQIFYKNHQIFVKYLTKQRFSFQNIARHIMREQKQSPQQSFDFIVEKGLCFGVGKDSYVIKYQIMFYMLLRDVASAILQLQQCGIFHGDIKLGNIILCNCSEDELNNIEQFKKKADKIKFKFIDFNFAFFIKGQNRKMTEEIIGRRYKKEKLQGDLIQEISCIKQKLQFSKILDGQTYKEIHSNLFSKILQPIIERNDIKVNIQPYEKMIKQRLYKEIIAQMNILIEEEKNKKN